MAVVHVYYFDNEMPVMYNMYHVIKGSKQVEQEFSDIFSLTSQHPT